jgi:hypothetical protein
VLPESLKGTNEDYEKNEGGRKVTEKEQDSGWQGSHNERPAPFLPPLSKVRRNGNAASGAGDDDGDTQEPRSHESGRRTYRKEAKKSEGKEDAPESRLNTFRAEQCRKSLWTGTSKEDQDKPREDAKGLSWNVRGLQKGLSGGGQEEGDAEQLPCGNRCQSDLERKQ